MLAEIAGRGVDAVLAHFVARSALTFNILRFKRPSLAFIRTSSIHIQEQMLLTDFALGFRITKHAAIRANLALIVSHHRVAHWAELVLAYRVVRLKVVVGLTRLTLIDACAELALYWALFAGTLHIPTKLNLFLVGVIRASGQARAVGVEVEVCFKRAIAVGALVVGSAFTAFARA